MNEKQPCILYTSLSLHFSAQSALFYSILRSFFFSLKWRNITAKDKGYLYTAFTHTWENIITLKLSRLYLIGYSLEQKTETTANAIPTAKNPIIKPSIPNLQRGEYRSVRQPNVLFELKKMNLNLFYIFSSLFQTFLSSVHLMNYY